MSAVFTGNGLGLVNSSLTQLGGIPDGSAGAGPGADRQYLNLANGNLLLQRQDEFLTFRGLGVGLNRTYNSLGQASDVGTDGWVTGFERHVALLSGTLNASGSVMRRYTGDGGYQDFTYVAANTYQSTAGDGAHDTLVWSSTDSTWTWTEGTTRSQEQYANHADAALQGRLLKLKSLKSDGVTPAVWNVIYNASNQIVEIRADDGTSTGDALLFTYDGNGRLAGVSTRENGATRTQVAYGYDAQGRLVTVTTDLTPDDASDNTWSSSSPLNDGRLFRTTYTYEGTSLRIASLRQSDGVLVSYTYDGNGRVTTVTHGDTNTNDTDGAGETISYAYGAGSTTATDSLGRTWTYAFDANGQLTQITSPAVAGQSDVTTYQYDAAGNVIQVKAVRGATVLSQKDYQYDTQGNAIKEWDAVGDAISRTFSATNQILTETRYTGIDPDGMGPSAPTGGTTTTYVYDAQDRLRFVRDQLGFVTEIAYAAGGNGIGQQSSIRTYLGAAYNGAYTEAAMATWATVAQKANSTLSEFSYDAWGRLSQRIDYAAVDGNNGAGVLDAGAGMTRYTYDAQGLLRQQIVVHGAGRSLGGAAPSGSEVSDFAYDGLGRLLSVTASVSGAVNTDDNTVQTTYVYTDSGMKIITTSDAGVTRTETRNAAGRLLSVNEVGLGGNVGGGMQARPTTYTYDSAGQLRIVQDAGGGRSFRFYDAEGRLEETVDATGAVVQMSYDGAGRVVQTRTYANRVTTTGWTSVATLPADISALGIAANDGLDHVVTTTYDAAGRIATVTDGLVSDANRSITTYAYDGRGQLLQTVQTDSVGAQATARTTRYFYDDAGNKTGSLDAEGYLTELQYDPAGRLIATIEYSVVAPANLLANGTLAQLRPAADAGKHVARYYYNGRGQLTGTLDSEMFLTEYVRDDTGNTRAERRYATAVTVVANDTLDTLRAKAGSTYRESRMAYNGLGQLVTETNAEGTVTRYTYDEAGRLSKTEVAQGTSEVRENNRRYNAFGELIGELGGEGSPHLQAGMTDAQLDVVYAQYGVRHSYDALGRRIESIDAAGNKTWYVYDASGRQTFQIRGVAGANNVPNGAGEVTETRYNAFGQVQDSIAYTGRITIATPGDRASVLQAVSTLQYAATLDSRQQFTYDTRGLLASRLDANGYLTRYSYTSFGQLKTQTGFRDLAQTQSEVTAYAYDRLGRLLTTTESSSGIDAQTRTLTQTWDAFNRVSVSDGRGSVASYTYDRLGRQVTSSRTVSGGVEQVRMAYDAYGRVTSQFDAALNETKFVYNDVAKSVTVTSPEGVTVTTAHNAFGQTQMVTDGLNQVTTFAYDHDGHLLSTKDALQASTSNAYDVRGLLHRTIDASGRIVELNYDAAGRVLTRVVDPNGLALTTTYVYDGQGRQIQVTDPSGVVTAMKYDLAGQLTETTVDPLGLALKTTYAWDGQGQQLTVTEGAGSAAAHTVAYAYDGLGRRISETVDPNGLALKTTYGYDGNDNVVMRMDAGGRMTSYAYDEANRVTLTVNGVNGVTRMTYDIKGQLIATRQYVNAMQGGTVVDDDAHDIQSYRVYDRDGRVRYVVDGAGGVTGYSYDAANRLAQTRSYATAIDINAARAGLQAGSLTPTVTADGARDEVTSQVYDAAGRMRFTVDAVGDVTESRYDAAGRVIETVTHATALTMTDALRAQLKTGMTDTAMASLADTVAGATRAQSFVYDGAGRRVFSVTRATVLGVAGKAVVTGVQYDAAGRVLSQTEYGAALASYQVFANSASLASALATAGASDPTPSCTSQMRYDNAGRLRFTIDPAGAVTESVYDAANQVTTSKRYGVLLVPVPETTAQIETWASSQVAANIRETQFQYDLAGRLQSQTDALGHAESWTYDGTGLKKTYTNHNGETWTYLYDGAGRQTAEFSPQVVVTTANASGQITQVSRAIVTRMDYDGTGNLIRKSEDADGGAARITEYGYDNRGHQILTRFPDAGQLSTDGSGNIAATGTRPTIEVTYDALGRAVVEKDVQGNYRQRVYDAAGQLSYEVDQEGGVTGYTYNAFGEQATLTRYGWGMAATGAQPLSAAAVAAGVIPPRTTYPDGSWSEPLHDANRTLTMRYDLSGRKVEVLQDAVAWYDGKGNNGTATPSTRYLYDVFGQLVKESVLQSGDPASSTDWANTLHYYDAAGRQVATVDAGGFLTRMEYNAQGELTKLSEFAIGLANATVGVLPGNPAAGNSLATGFDRVTEYQYDALGRKIVETAHRHDWSGGQANPVAADAVTNIGYDNEGHAISTKVNGVETKTAYDALGRVVSVTEDQRDVLRADAQTLLAANPTLRLGDASLYLKVSPHTTLAYDAYGNVVQTRRYALGLLSGAAAADQIHVTRYDWQGRAIWERDEAGTVYTRVYDAADHILKSSYRLDSNSAYWADVVTTATYDRTGRQVSSMVQRQMHRGSGGVSSTETDAASYVRYNVFGEIVAKGESAGALSDSSNSLQYSYDSAGRMVRSNEGGTWHDFGYNLAGGQTREQHQVRLTAIYGGTPVYQNAVTLQQFDRMGRVLVQSTPSADGGVTLAVVNRNYDRWGNVVAEQAPTGAVTFYNYNELNQVVVEKRPVVSVVHADGSTANESPTFSYGYNALGQLAWTKDANGGKRYTTLNTVGQVIATQDATGNVSRMAYNALGEQVLNENGLGYVTFQTFDVAGRVTEQGDFIANASGGRDRKVRESYVLNQNGNRLRVTDALGNAVAYDYDSRGLVLRSRTAAGVIMDYAYDLQGHKVRETNGLSDASLQADSQSALTYTGALPGVRVLPGGRAWSYILPSDMFLDASDQGYTIEAHVQRTNGAAPLSDSNDFSYNAATRTLSGTPAANCGYYVTFTARSNRTGEIATAQIYLNSMDAAQFDATEAGKPVANRGMPDKTAGINTSFSFALPAGTYVDPQGQSLVYGLRVNETHNEWVEDESGGHRESITDYFDLASSTLAGSVSIDPATGTISGSLPGPKDYYFEFVAMDPNGNECIQTFTLKVSAGTAAAPRRTKTDSDGNTVYLDEQTWKYDAFGRVVDHHDLGGAKYTYGYDQTTGQQILQHSDWSVSTTTTPIYDYVDENDTAYWAPYGGKPQGITGYQTTIVNSDRQLRYYANGQLAEIHENNNYTKYEYDINGNRTAEETLTYSDQGQTHLRTEMKYDSNNRLIRVTQTDLNTNPPKGLLDLRYGYDAMGNRVHVTAKGGYGTGQLAVVTTDLAPVVDVAIPNASFFVGQPWSWTIPAATFRDPEGTTLTLMAALADGNPLPSWVIFNPSTGQFTANPTGAQNVIIRVTATDTDGNTVSCDFNLVAKVNQAPVVNSNVPAQTAFTGQAWSYALPAGIVTDPEGQALTWTAKQSDGSALPSWLTFNAATKTFSGTPNAIGSFTIMVTVTDALGASTSFSFALTVPNQAPVANGSIAAQGGIVGVAWGYTAPAGIISDPEGQTLTWTAKQSNGSALPSWMTFNAATRAFGGTPTATGSITVTLTATDPQGASASVSFTLTVQANQAPIVNGSIPAQAAMTGQAWSYTAPAGIISDPEGQTLTWTAKQSNGSALPSWLTFNAATKTFSGTPTANGSVTITLVATDPQGGSASADFTLTIQTANQAPVANGSITAQSGIVGVAWSYTAPAGIITDPEGQTLTWTAKQSNGSALPSWLVFDAATRTFSGTPTATGGITVTLTATDPQGASASVNFTLTVQANQAPVVNGSIAAQAATAGQAWGYTAPAGIISDPEGQTLTWTAKQSNGSALPSWMTFNATTRAFGGTPTAAGSFTITLTATDPQGGSASVNFTMTIQAANQAPVVNGYLPVQLATVGQAWSYTVPAGTITDPEGQALTWTTSSLPSWMSFNAATRTLSGTPTSTGSPSITLTATDPQGASASVVLGMSIQPPNQAPVANSGVANQVAVVGVVWNYRIAASVITDPEGQTLTWTAKQSNGSALPSWLTFNGATRTFSGTPAANSPAVTIIVTATDPQGASASVQFGVDIAPYANFTATEGQNVSWFFDRYAFPGSPSLSVYEERADGSWVFSSNYHVGGSGGKFIIGSGLPVDGRYYYRIQVVDAWSIPDEPQIYVVSISQSMTQGASSPASMESSSMDAVDSSDLDVSFASSRTLIEPMLMAPPDDGEDPGTGGGGTGGSGGTGGTNTSQEYWYSYDAENRLKVAHGQLQNGQIVIANDDVSFALSYDAAGRATQRVSQSVSETTNYDERGERTSIVQNGALTESFSYDDVGRQTKHRTYAANVLKHLDVTQYDADGRTIRQASYGKAVTPDGLDMAEAEHLQHLSEVYYKPYDAAGRLTGYSYRSYSNEIGVGAANAPTNFSQIFAYTYEARESYLEKAVLGSSTSTSFKASTSTSTYDAWGRRIAVKEDTPNVSSRTRLFDYDMEGNILQRKDGAETERYAYVQGQNVASGKSSGALDVISRMTAYQTSEAGTTTVQVQAGDTLASLAQRVYGNGNLWYVLADANAIKDSELVAGTTLKVPQVQVTANDATTFKPFSPNEAIGNTAPELPYILPPPKHKCEGLVKALSMAIGIVVGVIVGIATWGNGAAAGAAGGFAGAHSYQTLTAMADGNFDWNAFMRGIMSPQHAMGSSLFLSDPGFNLYAQYRMANGSSTFRSFINPGEYGMKYDYKQIGIATAAGAAGGAIGGWVTSGTNAAMGTVASRALGAAAGAGISYAVNYQLSKDAGYDVHFSLREMAAGMVTAAAGSFISSKLGANNPRGYQSGDSSIKEFNWSQVAKDVTASVLSSAASYGIRKGFGLEAHWSWGDVAADAFGNALGNAIAGGIQTNRRNSIGLTQEHLDPLVINEDQLGLLQPDLGGLSADAGGFGTSNSAGSQNSSGTSSGPSGAQKPGAVNPLQGDAQNDFYLKPLTYRESFNASLAAHQQYPELADIRLIPVGMEDPQDIEAFIGSQNYRTREAAFHQAHPEIVDGAPATYREMTAEERDAKNSDFQHQVNVENIKAGGRVIGGLGEGILDDFYQMGRSAILNSSAAHVANVFYPGWSNGWLKDHTWNYYDAPGGVNVTRQDGRDHGWMAAAMLPTGFESLAARGGRTALGAARVGFEGVGDARRVAVTYEGPLYRAVPSGGDALDISYSVKANGRYTEPGQGGLYFASNARTVEAEFVGNGSSLVGRDLNVFEKSSVDNLLDLTDPAVRERLGVSLSDITRRGGTPAWRYEVTQPLGRLAQSQGYSGIIAPSAQADGGVNLILFSSKGVK